jgi:anti-sigma B factor antagonist
MNAAAIEQRSLNDDVAVIRPGKVLDNRNAHEMVEMISAVQASGHKYTLVDCAVLEFLSSAGVGSILGTVEVSREAGGDIILFNVHENIMHVLNVLDLVDYLTIRADEHEAMETCGIG